MTNIPHLLNKLLLGYHISNLYSCKKFITMSFGSLENHRAPIPFCLQHVQLDSMTKTRLKMDFPCQTQWWTKFSSDKPFGIVTALIEKRMKI